MAAYVEVIELVSLPAMIRIGASASTSPSLVFLNAFCQILIVDGIISSLLAILVTTQNVSKDVIRFGVLCSSLSERCFGESFELPR